MNRGRRRRQKMLHQLRVAKWMRWQDWPMHPVTIGRTARTPAHGPCELCRNPRHAWYGSKKNRLTMQERRADGS